MTARDFIAFILAHAGPRARRVWLSALANGLCLGLIMYSLPLGLETYAAEGAPSFRALCLFCLGIVAFYHTQGWGTRAACESAFSALKRLELRVADKLRRMDYAAFGKLDPGPVYAALGGDKSAVVVATRFLVPTLGGAVVAVLACAYLATISAAGLLLIVGAWTAVIAIRTALHKKIAERAAVDRAATNDFTASLRDILDGFAELKMNRLRSEDLFERRIAPAAARKTARLLGSEILHMDSLVLEQATLFAPLGLVVFLLPVLTPVPAADIVRMASVTLVAIWPAYTLVQYGPVAHSANLSLSRLRELEAELDRSGLDPAASEAPLPQAPAFRRIGFPAAAFSYPAQPNQEPFTVEARDFWLAKGELVVLRGGNGSGKSTFMRMLACLTRPDTGELHVDDAPASAVGVANCRALYSIVFPDFHLFDSFYGMRPDPERVRSWLERLGLDDKIRVENGRFSTTDLSSGQRKRLALLTAILEDRPVILMDEVAADFDAHFRDWFYRELLPGLKREGRTLLVISHDDRYYAIADRVLTMRYGKFAEGDG